MSSQNKLSDRFDLEQSICRVWAITDDIHNNTEDEKILAIVAYYDIMFNTLWDQFEEMCRNGSFKQPEIL